MVREHRLDGPGMAPDQRADAGQQLVDVIGLEHIVVRPGVQPRHPVFHRVAGRGHQHRHLLAPRPQLAQHLQPVAPGQAQVEQHQVVLLRPQRHVGHFAVLDPVHGVVLGAQHVQQGFADHRVVFYKQQAHNYLRGEADDIAGG